MNIYKFETGRFYLANGSDKPLAYLICPQIREGVVEIKTTFVDPSLRGQGIAKEMTLAFVEYARKEGLLIVPSCSYSIKFFDENPEYKNLLTEI